MSPACLQEDDPDLLVVHTPQIGGVLRRYGSEDTALLSRVMLNAVTNHRLGDRRLDNAARVGPSIVMAAPG